MASCAAGQAFQMLAAHDDFAAVGMVQPADQVEDGGLARTGRAHQSEKFPFGNFQIQTMQDFDPVLARADSF